MWFKGDVVADARDESRRLEVDGELWLVYELGPPYDRRGPSLVFESVNLIRRVRNFPSNWRDLSDSDLVMVKNQV